MSKTDEIMWDISVAIHFVGSSTDDLDLLRDVLKSVPSDLGKPQIRNNYISWTSHAYTQVHEPFGDKCPYNLAKYREIIQEILDTHPEALWVGEVYAWKMEYITDFQLKPCKENETSVNNG